MNGWVLCIGRPIGIKPVQVTRYFRKMKRLQWSTMSTRCDGWNGSEHHVSGMWRLYPMTKWLDQIEINKWETYKTSPSIKKMV